MPLYNNSSMNQSDCRIWYNSELRSKVLTFSLETIQQSQGPLNSQQKKAFHEHFLYEILHTPPYPLYFIYMLTKTTSAIYLHERWRRGMRIHSERAIEGAKVGNNQPPNASASTTYEVLWREWLIVPYWKAASINAHTLNTNESLHMQMHTETTLQILKSKCTQSQITHKHCHMQRTTPPLGACTCCAG